MSQGGWACPGHVVVSRIKLFKPDSAVHVTCNDSMEALEGRRGLRRAGLLFLLMWRWVRPREQALLTRTQLCFQMR